MSIVASAIVSQTVQIDGRIRADERHTDNIGALWLITSLVAGNTDLAAQLASHATQLAADIRTGEIAQNVSNVTTLGSLATYTLNYSTAAQNFAALRTAYATATQVQAIMIGDFLSTLTDAQLQTAFSMTAGQVTTLRTNKLTPAASAAATIRATTGQ